MPKIIKTTAQEDALKEIIESLKIITKANQVLASIGNTQDAIITVQINKDKVVMPVSAADATKLLSDNRKIRVAQVKSLSRKYAIVLDDDDQKIIDLAEAKKTTRETPSEPVASDASDDPEERDEDFDLAEIQDEEVVDAETEAAETEAADTLDADYEEQEPYHRNW